jgi:hypothetical protein
LGANEGPNDSASSSATPQVPPREAVAHAWRGWTRWAFAAIPALGLLELGAHLVQTCGHIDEGDWRAARDYVAAHASAEDLVTFAPRWADPLGREFFGPGLATLQREARADDTRFPRAFEVSIRGAHLGSIAGWRRADEQRFGAVRVTTFENPAPAPVIADLVSLFDGAHARVSQVQGNGETECSFVHGSVASGGLGYGPAYPADRFACPGGGAAAVSVVADLEYYPHRCIFAPPPGSGAARRLRFPGVRLGQSLRGHHAIYVEAERDRKGAPVTLEVHVGDAVLGQVVHRDGDGWKGFEFDTSALAGREAELVFDITSPSSDRRLYCFEATTR